jgi:hypothetical protein
MRYGMTASAIREFLSERDDLEVLRIHYCYQIGSTFTRLNRNGGIGKGS